MYSSWSTDLNEYHAHQRKIVRHFAPHMSDDALTKQERIYFVVGVTRVAVVFVVPSAMVLWLHAWLLMTPVFALVGIVSLIELVMALYRHFVLWPEGFRMRWNYWREIEMSEDCYKLKIMGYYHRKIAKFVGGFPVTLASSEIQRYYAKRGAFMVGLFTLTYVGSLLLLARATEEEAIRIWMAYLLAIGSGLVIFRFIKMHLIELPQVLLLRDHPEFAVSLVPPSETIPFARPVTTYDSARPVHPPMAQLTTVASTEKVSL